MGDEKQFSYFPEKKGQQSRFWRRKVRERKECSITHAACSELPTMRKQTWLKYKKLWGEQIVHLPEKCWSKHIKLHHCVGGLDETSWTITWGTSEKAKTSINIFLTNVDKAAKQWDLCWIYDVSQMESWIWQIYLYIIYIARVIAIIEANEQLKLRYQ